MIRKIEAMQKVFGKSEGKKCRDCCHLVRHEFSRVYYKCEVYGESRSEASDWRKKWNAYGMFNAPHKGRPLIEYVETMVKECEEEKPLEGQLNLLDY